MFLIKYIYKILELQTCEQQFDSIKIENEEEVARYYKLKKKLELVQDQMAVMINEPKYILPFLQPGRLVTVRYFNKIRGPTRTRRVESGLGPGPSPDLSGAWVESG